MIKKCHYDVILWGGFGSTKCDPNLTSHLRRFFAGKVTFEENVNFLEMCWIGHVSKTLKC